MLTREEYIRGAKERGIPEETINSVLAKKQFKPLQESGGLLGNALGFNVGNDAGYKTSNEGIGGPNELGKAVLPRAAAVAERQARGGSGADLNEGLGIVGEATNRMVSPFLGPLGMAVGGFAEGATDPNADLPQRLKQGVAQGAIEAAILPVGKFLKNPKGFVGKKLEKVYDTASAAGAQISKKDVLAEALVGTNLQKSRAAITDFVNKNLPGGKEFKQIGPYKFTVEDIKNFSPREAWELNKEISKTYGKNIFEYFMGASEEKQAAKAVREAMSRLLTDAAPGAKNWNKVYKVLTKVLSKETLAALGITGAGYKALTKTNDIIGALSARE